MKAELSSSQHKQTNKSDLLHISCQSFVIICTDRMSLSKKRGLLEEVNTKYLSKSLLFLQKEPLIDRYLQVDRSSEECSFGSSSPESKKMCTDETFFSPIASLEEELIKGTLQHDVYLSREQTWNLSKKITQPDFQAKNFTPQKRVSCDIFLANQQRKCIKY